MIMHLNISSANRRPFCPGRDELLKNLGYVLSGVTGDAGQGPPVHHDVHTIESSLRLATTVKPVCNDHLYDKIYYPWFIQ